MSGNDHVHTSSDPEVPDLPGRDVQDAAQDGAQSLGSQQDSRALPNIKHHSMSVDLRPLVDGTSTPGPHLLKKLQITPADPSRPVIVKRGKDWDSETRFNTARIQSPLIEHDALTLTELPPLRQAPNRNRCHRRARSQQEIPGNISNDMFQRIEKQERRPQLSLSTIQTISQSPITPPNNLIDRMFHHRFHSPVSLGPQSSTRSAHKSLSLPSERPSLIEILPKYTSAFDFAIRPYLELHVDMEQTSRTHQIQTPSSSTWEGSFDDTFPALRIRKKRGGSIASFKGSEDTGLSDLDDNIKSRTWDEEEAGTYTHTHATRLSTLYLSTLLTRCTIIQSWVDTIFKQPDLTMKQHGNAQMGTKKRGIHYHYTQMRYIATKARQIAEGLDTMGVLPQGKMARVEFWVGRAAGGTGDWGIARESFTRAKLLSHCGGDGNEGDERDKTSRKNSKGLKLHEQDVLPVLLEEVTRRDEIWTKEVENRRKLVRQRMREMSDHFGDGEEGMNEDGDLERLLEEELDWEGVARKMGFEEWDGWLLGADVGGVEKLSEDREGV